MGAKEEASSLIGKDQGKESGFAEPKMFCYTVKRDGRAFRGENDR